MATNMMCMNSKCKYYWEDCCTRNLEEERIDVDVNGVCITFREGISDYYQMCNCKYLLKLKVPIPYKVA